MPMSVTSPMIEEANRHSALSRWYRDKRLGQRLTDQLTEALNESLEQVFGYHMLVTGADMGLELSRLGKTQRLFRLVTRAGTDQPFQAVLGVSHELPFATDSLDALVLCHTLNMSPVPHQTLRECQRVLVPNGHLFVITFNPFSIWGLGSLLQRGLSRGRRDARAVSSRRLSDWLSLLGFAHAEPRYFASVSPLGRGRIARLMDRFDRWLVRINSPTGTAYLLHARKRVAAHLDSGAKVERPRLISIPLGKTQEGVPVPRQVTRSQRDGAETTQ